MSIGQKVQVLREQLGLEAGMPIFDAVDIACTQLGVKKNGLKLVQKVDACMSALSVASGVPPVAVQPEIPMGVVVSTSSAVAPTPEVIRSRQAPMAPQAQSMDRVGPGLTSTRHLNGCWVATLFPIPIIWALYHNQAVGENRVRGNGIAFFFCMPIPFEEHRSRRDGTNKFVHEQDGNNVLTYDNPILNIGCTEKKDCGLVTVRLCCH